MRSPEISDRDYRLIRKVLPCLNFESRNKRYDEIVDHHSSGSPSMKEFYSKGIFLPSMINELDKVAELPIFRRDSISPVNVEPRGLLI